MKMLEEKILNVMELDLEKTNFALAGCGYLGIYHVGVGSCMRQFCPKIFTNKLSGASVGALVAAAFLCEVPLESCTMSVINVVLQVRHGILGPITPDLDIMSLLYENMACILPEDAHLYCNDKLFISVTRYEDCKNILLSHFESKEELLQALMCSCFIPVYCGFEPPKFHGVAYVDGGYSNNCPQLDSHTITVAPFFGNTDICPRDKMGDFRTLILNGTSIFLTMENCRRLLRVLFPGPPDMMKELCQRGYNDALHFLRKNGLIQCPDCSSRMNGKSENKDHTNCKPVEFPIPMEINNEIDAAVQRLQQGFGQRLLRNPIVKLLYYVNMPSIFTAKISYSFFSAIARKLHTKTGNYIENAIYGSMKSESKILCHMEEGDLDVVETKKATNGNAKTETFSNSLMNNLKMEFEIKPQTSPPFFAEANDILRMALDNDDDRLKNNYNNRNDAFHVNNVTQHNIEIDNEALQMPNYFLRKHSAPIPEQA